MGDEVVGKRVGNVQPLDRAAQEPGQFLGFENRAIEAQNLI
jgi:hypothetical protein